MNRLNFLNCLNVLNLLRPLKRLAWLTALGLLGGTGSTNAPGAGAAWVYIGTFTGGASRGIYVARLDEASGVLSAPRLAAATTNPSYLAVAPDQGTLYAVNEKSGALPGTVTAFRIRPEDGTLGYLDEQASGGAGPCHVSVSQDGRVLLVANYASGSVRSLPLGADGRVEEGGALIPYHGHGVNPDRQAGPHAHFLGMDPSGRFALGCDLGTDRIMVFRVTSAGAGLAANVPAWADAPPGSGPRHLVFSRDGRRVYVVNEMGCTVAIYDWEAGAGRLTFRRALSVLPAGEVPPAGSTAAEILLHPSGRFVYVSVRGHDSLSVFGVNPVDGGLTLIQNLPAGGRMPRGLGLDPTGRWLLAGDQKDDVVTEFAVDPRRGRLTALPARLRVGSPVDFKFVAAR